MVRRPKSKREADAADHPQTLRMSACVSALKGCGGTPLFTFLMGRVQEGQIGINPALFKLVLCGVI